MITTVNIEILPELKNSIPPLSSQEYEILRESILTEGCRDPLVLWGGVLVDGHNRYKICTENGVEFETVQREFESIEDVKDWIDTNQLGRRNLTPNDFQLILGRRYNRQKNQGSRSDLTSRQNGERLKTSERLAKEHGVSSRTVERAGRFAEAVEQVEREEPETPREEIFKKAKAHVSYNSGENEWYTPEHIIKSARAVMGSIDLDPASSELANKIIKADKYYTQDEDGLKKKWGGNVWLNPPYAQPLISNFSDKVVREYPNVKQMCVLVNNATETAWLQSMINICDAICLIKGRLKFIDKKGNPTGAPLQGQVVLYFGSGVKKFIKHFNEHGICLTRGEQ